jgi:DNA-directed RNA polymerase specialized sigma24 family protein
MTMMHDRDRDDELLRAWRKGDAQAGTELFDRHADAVARFLANKVDDDAAELVQATFVRMLDGRDRVRRGGAFRAYALATARSVLQKHLREQSRGRMVDFEVDSVAQLTRRPSSIIGEREEHLRQIMAELSAEPGVLRRAMEGVEDWAAELRERLPADRKQPR